MHHHNILYHSLPARNWVWGSLHQKTMFFWVGLGWGRWDRGCVYSPVTFLFLWIDHILRHPFLGLRTECVVWGDKMQHFSTCLWEQWRLCEQDPSHCRGPLRVGWLGSPGSKPLASKCFNSVLFSSLTSLFPVFLPSSLTPYSLSSLFSFLLSFLPFSLQPFEVSCLIESWAVTLKTWICFNVLYSPPLLHHGFHHPGLICCKILPQVFSFGKTETNRCFQ